MAIFDIFLEEPNIGPRLTCKIRDQSEKAQCRKAFERPRPMIYAHIYYPVYKRKVGLMSFLTSQPSFSLAKKTQILAGFLLNGKEEEEEDTLVS